MCICNANNRMSICPRCPRGAERILMSRIEDQEEAMTDRQQENNREEWTLLARLAAQVDREGRLVWFLLGLNVGFGVVLLVAVFLRLR